MIGSWLVHPMTRGLEMDNPRSAFLVQRVIREKPFLRHVYEEWYRSLADALPNGHEPVIEIGAGPGFLQQFIPDIISTDIAMSPGIALAADATRLPFRDSSLRAILMTAVLHHLAQPRSFFSEAARCVRPGGVIAMVEPWVSPWSRLVFGTARPEPFMPEAIEWESWSNGSQSGSNGALAWMIFERDRQKFEKAWPEWQIDSIRPIMPFRYLLAGGIRHRSLLPGATCHLISRLEHRLNPWMDSWAMFAEIRLIRSITII
jgi:SAM-dependent methyltransferase